MRTCATTIIAALVLALLGGCSTPALSPTPSVMTSSASATSPSASSASPTPSASSTEPETSERGNTVKALGETAKLIDGNGDLAVTFTVTKIDRNFKCNSGYADKSENGHYIGVWMKIQTTQAVDFNSDDYNVVPYFNPDAWQVVGPDGTTENDSAGNGYSCAKDSEALPPEVGPGKKVSGVVVLDTKYKNGYLVMMQDYMDTGWEWKF